jgi:uncharacterized surface protein with fasciclin (FAS1) repeats
MRSTRIMRFKRIGTGAAVAALTISLAMPAQAQDQDQDIVDIAVGAGSFNTLVAAVQAAGLVETLKGEGPFTVFAPTDEAFAKLPAGTVEDLLKPENIDKLRAILTYHVVPGKVSSSDVANLRSAATVQGQPLQIRVRYGTVNVDNAKVVQADIMAKNGVIHVIDTVVIPTMDW